VVSLDVTQRTFQLVILIMLDTGYIGKLVACTHRVTWTESPPFQLTVNQAAGVAVHAAAAEELRFVLTGLVLCRH
jgi:hypothetical protein